MRVLVCGGRNYTNYKSLSAALNGLHIDVLIHGAAAGADSLADRWARMNGVQREAYPADWDTHGKAAGPIRNKQMLVEGKPDFVVAFPGGTGTANMVKQAEAAGIRVLRVAQ